MIEPNPDGEGFKARMYESLWRATKNSAAIEIKKDATVYVAGDALDKVFVIERGKVKLSMVSSKGNECLLAIHSAGDVFGELCLSGLEGRSETATAMEETHIKQLPCEQFLNRLATDSLLVGFANYLTLRVAAQQKVIANLIRVDSEQRLNQTLRQIAGKHGEKDPATAS